MLVTSQRLPPGSSVVDGRLTFARATVDMSGDYTCRALDVDGSYEEYARLDVVPCTSTKSDFVHAPCRYDIVRLANIAKSTYLRLS